MPLLLPALGVSLLVDSLPLPSPFLLDQGGGKGEGLLSTWRNPCCNGGSQIYAGAESVFSIIYARVKTEEQNQSTFLDVQGVCKQHQPFLIP